MAERALDPKWMRMSWKKCEFSHPLWHPYRVGRRHSFHQFLAVSVQVVLVGGNRRIGAWLHELWQIAERQRRRWSGTQLQVRFGAWGVGETGGGHGEEEIIRERLDRLWGSFFAWRVSGEFRGWQISILFRLIIQSKNKFKIIRSNINLAVIGSDVREAGTIFSWYRGKNEMNRKSQNKSRWTKRQTWIGWSVWMRRSDDDD